MLLAAIQHACIQAARICATGLQAALQTRYPLDCYETADYYDGTEAFDPEYEAEGTSLAAGLEQFARGEGVSSDWLFDGERLKGDKDIACVNCPTQFTVDDLAGGGCTLRCTTLERVLTDSGAVPVTASDTPAPVDGTPPASPGAGLSSISPEILDWIEPILLDVLTLHRPVELIDGTIGCSDDEDNMCPSVEDLRGWREHVANILRWRLELASSRKAQ